MNTFNYTKIEELKQDIQRLHVDIQVTNDFSCLAKNVHIGNHIAANSFAILPMEGCDSEFDGAPSDFVFRRYHRFALGGAGLIWGEANAIAFEGKANCRQMMITKNNVSKFLELVSSTKRLGFEANGYYPLMITQLTHSGRYSRPSGHTLVPIIPQRDPILDARSGVADETPIVDDAYLESLVPRYIQAALLAQEAGYDGIDVKACHRYLLNELLASHTRKGKYGGKLENRSRLLLDIISAIRNATGPDFIIASRFNIFDGHPYPYGFGCSKTDMWDFDPTEPISLVKEMIKRGVNLLSCSAGNPYYIYPQITRPFDQSSTGIPIPEENQLVSIERLFFFSSELQKVAGSIPVIGNGYSWLRHFIPYVAAANIRNHKVSMIGLGRCAFAYPDAPKDILVKGKMEKTKVCITCSKCTQIMRDHGTTGCVIRDSELYAPLYKKFHREALERELGK